VANHDLHAGEPNVDTLSPPPDASGLRADRPEPSTVTPDFTPVGAARPSERPGMKVLLVSSYRVSCGIATYTEALETLLEKDFALTVFALDQSILKSRIPHVIEAGDQQIRELCASFKDYDVVNFQWEPGLLGDGYKETAKRLGWILEAADKLILTVHTVVPYPRQRGLMDLASFVRRKGVKGFYRYFLDPEDLYRRETYRVLRQRAASDRKTFVAVHTNREKQFFQNVVGFKNVFDHPLSLIHAGWPERLAQDAPRARADLEEMFPGKHTFIGVFGFISEYKGMHTALKAMKLLGPGYQLLIYGGVHPGVLQEREPVNSYVKTLIDEIEFDSLPARKRRASGASGSASASRASSPSLSRRSSASSSAVSTKRFGSGSPAPSPRRNVGLRKTLLDKVAFLGAPDDYDFALAMKTMDICVFPYLEVGQSGSGPVSIAIELGKPTIASRTKAFIELARYHPKHFEMIDIGNHIQLGQAIQRMTRLPAATRPVEYNGATLAAFYGRLIRTIAGRPADEPARTPEHQANRQAA